MDDSQVMLNMRIQRIKTDDLNRPGSKPSLSRQLVFNTAKALVLLLFVSFIIAGYGGTKVEEIQTAASSTTAEETTATTTVKQTVAETTQTVATTTLMTTTEATVLPTPTALPTLTVAPTVVVVKVTPTKAPAVPTVPPVPAAPTPAAPLPPYYLYAEKGSFSLVAYGLDGSNNYTQVVRVMRMAIGRGTMTPTGKFTLTTRERWHSFSGSYAQYAVKYKSSLYIHGPLYKQTEIHTLIPSYYEAIGTIHTSGCLRLATGDVYWIFNNCGSGTVLEIVKDSPRGFTAPALIPLVNRNEDPTDPLLAPAPTPSPEPTATPTPTPVETTALVEITIPSPSPEPTAIPTPTPVETTVLPEPAATTTLATTTAPTTTTAP